MVNKRLFGNKAFMLTVEAFFAFFITFIFVIFVVTKGISAKSEKIDINVLDALEERDDFRDCVYAGNNTCIESLVRPFIPVTYNFKISINTPSISDGTKDIYTETLFVAGNTTGDYKIIYLYYWPISG